MKKGTYVSRAVYTKLQIENKALLQDIYNIVMMKADGIRARKKWQDKFNSDKKFYDELRAILLPTEQPKIRVFTKEQENEICKIIDARIKY